MSNVPHHTILNVTYLSYSVFEKKYLIKYLGPSFGFEFEMHLGHNNRGEIHRERKKEK